ncbi:hypothetical protein [Nocardioides convexus]|uniref:hypothetical protein n=1 Tax=Nocardioides convexus TaxID=2712224 RepID=UPI0024185BC9|nr:hypothetical protein [Nocardioides convexus]
MEILLWLVPAGVATVVAMLWVGWWGREGRGQVDRETAARRLGEALSRERGQRPGYAVPEREEDRSTGVALRASRRRPVVLPGSALPEQAAEEPEVRIVEPPSAGEQTARDRRAS